MFEILLLLAAAFSGHEVVSKADTPATRPPAVVQTVVRTTPGPTAAPSSHLLQVADETTQRPDAADIDSAIDRISDFYDTTPLANPSARPAAAGAARRAPVAPRAVLGPHLVGSTEKYMSEGRPVVIEVLRPDDDARRPAVLILHGASGIGDGTFYRGAAEIFAEHGYVTFLPHYLEAIRLAPAKTAKGRAKVIATRSRPGSIRAGFPEQEQVLRDAINYIADNSYVDSTHIGIFGLSLGGFHALTLSSRDDRIVAVVDMSGALRGNAIPSSNRLAPTLELHGARDPIIPVARAKALANTLSRLGVPHELKIYPNQGHFLRGKAQQDALQRAAEFFGTYLIPSETSHAERSTNGVD